VNDCRADGGLCSRAARHPAPGPAAELGKWAERREDNGADIEPEIAWQPASARPKLQRHGDRHPSVTTRVDEFVHVRVEDLLLDGYPPQIHITHASTYCASTASTVARRDAAGRVHHARITFRFAARAGKADLSRAYSDRHIFFIAQKRAVHECGQNAWAKPDALLLCWRVIIAPPADFHFSEGKAPKWRKALIMASRCSTGQGLNRDSCNARTLFTGRPQSRLQSVIQAGSGTKP
jgi:hypothetical protein